MVKIITQQSSAPIAGLNFWPLGTASRPYPMVATNDTLSAVSSDQASLHVPSRRPYNEAMDLLYRQMPVPSMLRVFDRFLKEYAAATYQLVNPRLVHAADTRLMHVMVGQPGIGKTHLGDLVGSVLDLRGPVKFNVAGIDMSQVVWQTVLDPQTSQPLIDKINERLARGQIGAETLAVLENIFKDLEDDKHPVLSVGSLGQPVINWEHINRKISPKRMPAFLESAATLLGLKGGSATGFHVVDMPGPAQIAYKEGRILLIDEADKSKPGTAGKLQGFFEFLDGERPSYLAHSNDGQLFDFRREEVTPGFFAAITGNKREDGPASGQLNMSTLTRMAVDEVPNAQARDIIHRIEQELCGWPISTIYHGLGGTSVWGANTSKFALFMANTMSSLNSHSPGQTFEDWPYVQEAATRLGKWFHDITELARPASQMRREVTDEKMRSGLRHADENYARSGLAPNLRDVFRIMKASRNPLRSRATVHQDAIFTSPDMDWSKPPTTTRPIDAQAVDDGQAGDRLAGLLHDYIQTRGPQELNAVFHEKAVQHKLFKPDRDDDLGDALDPPPTQLSSVRVLLNRTTGNKKENIIRQWRDASWAAIAYHNGAVVAGAKSLLTMAKMESVYDMVLASYKIASERPGDAFLLFPEINIEQAVQQPFGTHSFLDPLSAGFSLTETDDAARQSELERALITADQPNSLPSIPVMILGFALPVIGQANWAALKASSKDQYSRLHANSLGSRIDPVVNAQTADVQKQQRELHMTVFSGQDSQGRQGYVAVGRGENGRATKFGAFNAGEKSILLAPLDRFDRQALSEFSSSRTTIIDPSDASAKDTVASWLKANHYPVAPWHEALRTRLGHQLLADSSTRNHETMAQMLIDPMPDIPTSLPFVPVRCEGIGIGGRA